MNNEKDNVYDLVEDFYAHDEGWNTLLRQEYAEGFLRMEAWKGKKNSDLYRSWDNLTMLCLYLGSAETFLGDMNADDFIDCKLGAAEIFQSLLLIIRIHKIF